MQTDADKLKQYLMPHVKKWRIQRLWLFGSCARGEPMPTSDIDIAIEPMPAQTPRQRSDIEDLIASAPILRNIDVVWWHTAPAGLRETILHEGIVWYDAQKNS